MSRIVLHVGDTARAITDTLLLGGAALDLSAATGVVMVWRSRADGTVARKTATIDDAATGQVSYQPVTADVDTPGRWDFEWEITYSDATGLTVPTAGYHTLVIEADLDA